MIQQYQYKAYDRAGVVHEGEIAAVSIDSAGFKLKEQGFIPVSVRPQKSEQSLSHRLLRWVRTRKPTLADIEFWSSQVALLLHNGIKVDRALETAQHAVANHALKKITGQIHENVRTGMSLTAALRMHPNVFDALYVSVINIGDATGRLAEAFSELTANLAFRKQMISRTRQAMAYPAIISVVCILSVVFIFNFIVPRFETLFSRMADPPLATILLLHAAHFFTRYQWPGLILIVSVPFIIGRMGKFPLLRHLFDGLVLKFPITRHLVYTSENLRFASAMAMMLNSGVLLVDALGYAVSTVSNSFISKRLAAVKESVKQGKKLSEAMSKTGFLPQTYAGIIEVGEQAGRLAIIFKDMEGRMRTDYEQRLSNLITLIEPLMIIIMGLIVGSIVVIMLLSTISLNEIAL